MPQMLEIRSNRARIACLLACVAATWLLGCEKRLQPEQKQPSVKQKAPQTDPATKVAWEVGPGVDQPAELKSWIQEVRAKPGEERPLVRIPVVASMDEHRLQISSAFLGVSADASNHFALRLDDSALGISLVARLRHRCPEDRRSCVIWVEGYWGPLLDLPRDPDATPPYPFAVLEVLSERPANATNVLIAP